MWLLPPASLPQAPPASLFSGSLSLLALRLLQPPCSRLLQLLLIQISHPFAAICQALLFNLLVAHVVISPPQPPCFQADSSCCLSPCSIALQANTNLSSSFRGGQTSSSPSTLSYRFPATRFSSSTNLPHPHYTPLTVGLFIFMASVGDIISRGGPPHCHLSTMWLVIDNFRCLRPTPSLLVHHGH